MMTVANRSDTGHKLDWMLDCVPIRVRDIWQIAEDAIIRPSEVVKEQRYDVHGM